MWVPFRLKSAFEAPLSGRGHDPPLSEALPFKSPDVVALFSNHCSAPVLPNAGGSPLESRGLTWRRREGQRSACS
ncbi:unnamed protein product [Lota lota]